MVVVPADTPVTIPEDVTVATAGTVLLQIPPVAVVVREMVLPTHTEPGPVIAPATGTGSIVTILVAYTVPHIFVMV
jgi:hypothetical protein